MTNDKAPMTREAQNSNDKIRPSFGFDALDLNCHLNFVICHLKSKGFTLIEVITATAISVIVLAAIGSLLMGSFQIIKLLDSRKDAALEGALIALEGMASEIQRAPAYQATPMEGDGGKISFYQLVSNSSIDPYQKAFRLGQVQNATLSGATVWIKKVEYTVDPDRGVMIRKTESGDEKVIADHLSGAQFSYALDTTLDADNPSWEWKDKISNEDERKLKAIRIVLEFKKDGPRYVIPGVEKTFLVMRKATE